MAEASVVNDLEKAWHKLMLLLGRTHHDKMDANKIILRTFHDQLRHR